MQKDGKVFADRQKAVGLHLRGRGAYNDPVVVLHGAAQQFVAHGAAYVVDAGAGNVKSGRGGHGVRKN